MGGRTKGALSILLSVSMAFWLTPTAWADDAQEVNEPPAREQGPDTQGAGLESPADAPREGSGDYGDTENVEPSSEDVYDAEVQALVDEVRAVKQSEPATIGESPEEADDANAKVAETQAAIAELAASLQNEAAVLSDASPDASALSVGSGTAEDPYLVSSAADLAAVASDASAGVIACYALANDISLAGV